MSSFPMALARGVLCGWLALGPAGAAAGELLTVSGAWVSPTVPGQSVGAAYMQLRSEQDASLIKIETDASSSAEMHQMTSANDVMRMRQLDQVELPAGRSESFAPGGRHVMLVDLRRPLNAGDNVRITLTLRLRDGRMVQEIFVAPVLRNAAHGIRR